MQPFKFGIKSYAMKMAMRLKIDLVMYGEDGTEYGSNNIEQADSPSYDITHYTNDNKDVYIAGRPLKYLLDKHKLEMNDFKRAADIVLSRGLGSHITREELSPALKLCVNYASYKTFNTILEDMQNKIPLYKKAGDALVGLSAKLKAEAMFGNTLLPLWIVYGMGGGAHYKHTRNEFEDKTGAEIAELGESMDVPYLVIQIGRSGGKQSYNAIYLLILSGSIKKGDEILPEYVKIQFINRSGSGFSYKIDAMSTQVGYK